MEECREVTIIGVDLGRRSTGDVPNIMQGRENRLSLRKMQKFQETVFGEDSPGTVLRDFKVLLDFILEKDVPVFRTPFDDGLLSLLTAHDSNDLFQIYQREEEKTPPFGSLQPVFQSSFPAWKNNLSVSETGFREGVYIFKTAFERMRFALSTRKTAPSANWHRLFSMVSIPI